MSGIGLLDNRALRRLVERIDDVTEDAEAYGVQRELIGAALISAATHTLGLPTADAQEVADLMFSKVKK